MHTSAYPEKYIYLRNVNRQGQHPTDRLGLAGRIDAAGRPSRIGPGEEDRGRRQAPLPAGRIDATGRLE